MNQELQGWHGSDHDLREQKPGQEMYIAPTREIARGYGSKIHRVTYHADNPLEIQSGHEIDKLIDDAGGFGENWHPDTTSRIANVARARGHDAVILPPRIFKDPDEKAWEMAVGTYGDPQTVLLHPHKAVFRRVK